MQAPDPVVVALYVAEYGWVGVVVGLLFIVAGAIGIVAHRQRIHRAEDTQELAPVGDVR